MEKLTYQLKKYIASAAGQKMLRHVWLVPAFCIIWTVLSYNVRTLGLSRRVTGAIEEYKKLEQQAAAPQMASKAAEDILKKNPFSGAQPAPSVPQCLGILGNYALFNNTWYKVGDTVQEAKILAVEPTAVKILWQGKEQSLRPFDVEVQYSKSESKPSGQQAQASASDQQMPPMPPMMGGRGGFDPRNMSPEQLSQMRDRFMNMSPDERRRAFDEMRGRRGQ